MKRLLLSFIFSATVLSYSQTLQAQTVPNKIWDKTFGGNDSDLLLSLQQTSDGGYILGGYSRSGVGGSKSQVSQGMADYWVIKLDASGNKLWDKTFGGSDNDILTTVQQTNDGGYILGGYSLSSISGDKSQASQGNSDYWILKLDNSGSKVWDKTFGGSADDYLFSLQQTSDGGYILGGTSLSGISGDKTQPSKGQSDFWVIKLDNNGNKTWDKSLGGNRYEDFTSLQQTSDGSYILGGDSNSGISGDKTKGSQGISDDYWVIKLDATGNKLWDNTFGGNNADYLKSLQQTADGGYILGGRSNSDLTADKTQASQGGFDYWLVKLDGLGNKVWDKTFGGTGQEEGYSLKEVIGGGYVIGGNSNSNIGGHKSQPSQGLADYWVVRLDPSGNKLWDKTFGGNNSDELYSLLQTSDGGFIFGGQSISGISGDKSQINNGLPDFWLIKTSPEILGTQDSFYAEFNLYPNPTNGIVNLKVHNQPVNQIAIYNALGQCIYTKNLVKTDSEELLQVDLSEEAKGVYTIQVLSDNQVTTRKVVLQ